MVTVQSLNPSNIKHNLSGVHGSEGLVVCLSSQSTKIASSFPVLTASWICPWQSRVQLFGQACKQLTGFASRQLVYMSLSIIFFCFCPYLWATIIDENFCATGNCATPIKLFYFFVVVVHLISYSSSASLLNGCFCFQGILRAIERAMHGLVSQFTVLDIMKMSWQANRIIIRFWETAHLPLP